MKTDKISYDKYITSSREADYEIVKEYFSFGMNKDDFIKLRERKPTYYPKNGEYRIINYNFENKLHYSEIESMLFNMNNLDIVSLELLAVSSDRRNIYGIEIGSGTKTLYIDATIHAGEVGNTVILMRFLSELLNNYYLGDESTIEALKHVKLAIMPCINPDGYEIYNFGKNSINNKELWLYQNYEKIDIDHLKSNANGVDINRNFPSQNGGLYYKDMKLMKSVAFNKTTTKGKHFPGESLGSEEETKACMYFMYKHREKIYAYLNMHSQGRVIYNGKPNLSDEYNNISKKFAKFIASYNKYKVYGINEEEVGRGNDGTATDFMSEIAHDFIYSEITNRLSTTSYVNNSKELVYKYPSVTLETLTNYTRNVKEFKKEYYDKKIRDILFEMIKCNFLED